MIDTEKAALERRIDELCAEVEALKRDEWAAGFSAGCDAVEAAYEDGRQYYEVENAKLRKLALGLNWCTEGPDGPRVDCEHCPLGVVDGEPLELMCEKMMRELGVEADE